MPHPDRSDLNSVSNSVGSDAKARQAARTAKLTRSICLAGLTAFLAALVAEHLMHPGLAPRDHRISEYVNAPWGWVMTIGFIGSSAALAGTALLVCRSATGRPRSAIAALLIVAAIGIAVVAVFPTQTSAGQLPRGVRLTWTGRAHDLGSAAAFVALLAAAIAGALTDATWRHVVVIGPLLIAGVASLAMALIGVDAPGVRQRVLVLGAVLWLAAAATILAGRQPLRD